MSFFFVIVILLCVKMLAIGSGKASEDFFEIFRKSSILDKKYDYA